MSVFTGHGIVRAMSQLQVTFLGVTERWITADTPKYPSVKVKWFGFLLMLFYFLMAEGSELTVLFIWFHNFVELFALPQSLLCQ